MVRNGEKLYYPVVEMIKSILPIVDEFIIAIGKGDEDDNTRKLVVAIGDPKIKIIDTEWDIKKYPNGMENAHQTDIAKCECKGDWLIYLQADEVIHEKYLPIIHKRCSELRNNPKVEGFILNYKHFWGDYDHYHKNHRWYPYEVRIIRNDPDIHSWESAQSFRRIPNFNGLNFRQQNNTYKLNVAKMDAYIYHYGWVRPPNLMRNKQKALNTVHRGTDIANKHYDQLSVEFDYGPLNRLFKFKDTHPEVMNEMIAKMNWKDSLQYKGKLNVNRELQKHEMFKYRLISFIENYLLFGYQLGGFKNYNILKGI